MERPKKLYSPLIASRKLVANSFSESFQSLSNYNLNVSLSMSQSKAGSVEASSLEVSPPPSIFSQNRKIFQAQLQRRRINKKRKDASAETVSINEDLLRSWDSGSKVTRKKILSLLVNSYQDKNGEKIMIHQLEACASLMLSRLLAWLRLTYLFNYAVSLQIQALLVFFDLPNKEILVTEFLEAGGVDTLLEILSLGMRNQISEEALTFTLRALISAARTNSLVKSYFHLKNGVNITAENMLSTTNKKLQQMSSELYAELYTGEPSLVGEIRTALVKLIISENDSAQLVCLQLVHTLLNDFSETFFQDAAKGFPRKNAEPNSFLEEADMRREDIFARYTNCLPFIQIGPSVFSSTNEEAKLKGIELLIQMSKQNGCMQSVVENMVAILKEPFQTKDELALSEESKETNNRRNTSLSIHTCALKVINGIYQDENDGFLIQIVLRTQVCEGLCRCLFNIHNYETQKMAVQTCANICKISPQISDEMSGILGKDFVREISVVDYKTIGRLIGTLINSETKLQEISEALESRGWNTTSHHIIHEIQQVEESDMLETLQEMEEDDEAVDEDKQNEEREEEREMLEQEAGNPKAKFESANIDTKETKSGTKEMSAGKEEKQPKRESLTFKRLSHAGVVSSFKIPRSRSDIADIEELKRRQSAHNLDTEPQRKASFKKAHFVEADTAKAIKLKNYADKVNLRSLKEASNAKYALFEPYCDLGVESLSTAISLSQREEKTYEDDTTALDFIRGQWVGNTDHKKLNFKTKMGNVIVSRGVETVLELPEYILSKTGHTIDGLDTKQKDKKLEAANVKIKNRIKIKKTKSKRGHSPNNTEKGNKGENKTKPKSDSEKAKEALNEFAYESVLNMAILHSEREAKKIEKNCQAEKDILKVLSEAKPTDGNEEVVKVQDKKQKKHASTRKRKLRRQGSSVSTSSKA